MHIMRIRLRERVGCALRWLLPSRVYFRVCLGTVKCLNRIGFHRLNARWFGGADAPAWAFARRWFWGRP